MPNCQHVFEKHNIGIPYTSLKNIEESKYFGPTVTNQNCAHKEIKSRLNF
jgi:hypothetical protein